MQSGLKFLSELSEAAEEWILGAGTERQVIANTAIIQEGKRCDALFIILEGLCALNIAGVSDAPIATLGPGEMFGDISFLENRLASASVTALESSLLLELPRPIIEKQLKADAAFAAGFYRALAVLNAQRLRERVSRLGAQWQERFRTAARGNTTWEKLDDGIRQFKEFMLRADAEALKNDNVISQKTTDLAVTRFRDFCLLVNSLIGDSAEENISVKVELGARVQREILPYLLLTETGERFYSKPRGYAGDFFTIELIYENVPRGAGRIGAMLDKCFLEYSASKAVRNRRSLLADEIQGVIKENQGKATAITSLACGPAEELFDVFEQLEKPDQLKVSCLDIDMQALAFVSEKRDKRRLQNRMQLINANLIYLALGRQKLDLNDQDLIYSIGLIDYFNDKLVTKLLDWIHARLRPGGKVIVGNFHPRNSSKAMMDYLLEWKLIHRTEKDMDRLFSNSAFRRPSTKVRFEEENINLFAECIRSSP